MLPSPLLLSPCTLVASLGSVVRPPTTSSSLLLSSALRLLLLLFFCGLDFFYFCYAFLLCSAASPSQFLSRDSSQAPVFVGIKELPIRGRAKRFSIRELTTATILALLVQLMPPFILPWKSWRSG